MKEDDLSRLFANSMRASSSFASWVLSQTKFAEVSEDSILLHGEQAARRPNPDNWWKDWWCPIPGLSVEGRQIDIFACFEIKSTGVRYALVIENKKKHGKFEPGQAKDYERLASTMIQREKNTLRLDQFETVLIAPTSFRNSVLHREECDHFNAYISYEKISPHIPEFLDHL